MSSRKKASLWFTVCNGFQSAMGLLSLPLFTRLMLPDQFGQIAVYNSWMGILTIFATLNVFSGVFNNGMVTFRNHRGSYLASMQGLVLFGTVAAFCLTAILHFAIPRLFDLSIPMFIAMFIQILASSLFSLWAAYQRYEYKYRGLIVASVFFVAVTTVISLVAVALTPEPMHKALVRVSTGALSSLVVALILAARIFARYHVVVDRQYWRFAIRFNLPLIPHYLAFIVLSQIDRIIIARYLGSTQAAMYSVASSIGQVLTVLVGALAASLTPWTYERLAARQIDGMGMRFWQGTTLVAAVSLSISLAAPELMRIAAPAGYGSAAPVVVYIAFSSVFLFIYSVFANIEFFYMANKFVPIASCAAAMAKVISNYFVIPRWGITGAGVTTLLCYGVFALSHTLFTRRLCRAQLKETTPGYFSFGRVWAIALIATSLGFLTILIFPYPGVRASLLLLALSVCWYKRAIILNGIFGRATG